MPVCDIRAVYQVAWVCPLSVPPLKSWRKSRQPRAIWWIGLMSHWLILFNLMLSCPNKRIAGKNAKLVHVIMFKIYWSEFGCYCFPLVSIVFTLVMLDILRQAPYWGMQRKKSWWAERVMHSLLDSVSSPISALFFSDEAVLGLIFRKMRVGFGLEQTKLAGRFQWLIVSLVYSTRKNRRFKFFFLISLAFWKDLIAVSHNWVISWRSFWQETRTIKN